MDVPSVSVRLVVPVTQSMLTVGSEVDLEVASSPLLLLEDLLSTLISNSSTIYRRRATILNSFRLLSQFLTTLRRCLLELTIVALARFLQL